MLRVDLEELTELENDEYDNFDDDTNYEPNDEENELDEDEGKSLANSIIVFNLTFKFYPVQCINIANIKYYLRWVLGNVKCAFVKVLFFFFSKNWITFYALI